MKKPLVLIVEDDEWLAQQQCSVIKAAGYRAEIASHALAAIEAVDIFKPNVMILDVLLGADTAFALLHELQSYGDTGKIPIIICTNLAADLSLEDLQPYGVRRILDKASMLPGDLVASIRSVLL